MNPYEVLGVDPGADEETIKKAHRALVKKYHPDRYVDNPLADLAAEKMKEINKAYDMIMKGNNNQNVSGSYQPQNNSNGYGNYSSGGYNNISFESVRVFISMGQYGAALNMLNSLNKTAEWYYLRGIINMRRGYYDQAVIDLDKAVQMDPSNVEYRSAVENIKNRTATYTTTGQYGTGCCDCAPCMCVPCICPCGCC